MNTKIIFYKVIAGATESKSDKGEDHSKLNRDELLQKHQSASFDDKSPQKTTCPFFHFACSWGNLGVVKTLLQETTQDINGITRILDTEFTPLSFAAAHDQSGELTKLLLKYGADPKLPKSSPPAHSACWAGNLEALRLILAAQTQKKWIKSRQTRPVDRVNSRNETLLVIAAGQDQTGRIIQFLIQEKAQHTRTKIYIAGETMVINTAVHAACEHQNIIALRYFLEHTSAKDLALTTAKERRLLLTFVLMKDRSGKMLQLLLEKNIGDLSEKSKEGIPTLHYATQSNSIQTLKAALSSPQGQKALRHTTIKGKTILDRAVDGSVATNISGAQIALTIVRHGGQVSTPPTNSPLHPKQLWMMGINTQYSNTHNQYESKLLQKASPNTRKKIISSPRLLRLLRLIITKNTANPKIILRAIKHTPSGASVFFEILKMIHEARNDNTFPADPELELPDFDKILAPVARSLHKAPILRSTIHQNPAQRQKTHCLVWCANGTDGNNDIKGSGPRKTPWLPEEMINTIRITTTLIPTEGQDIGASTNS